MQGLMVTETISGASAKNPKYPLLPEDLLTIDEDGTYFKECPGIAMGGFTLTAEQASTLKPVEFTRRGLEYVIHNG